MALAYGIPLLLQSDWPTYKLLLEREESARNGGQPAHITACPCAVVTRWWTVVVAAIWLTDHLNGLKSMADYIYKYFDSKQGGCRARWKAVHIHLSNSVLVAQLRALATFGRVHYMPEMKWSEDVDPQWGVPGFKAHLLPHRLLERCAALETLIDGVPQVFADALEHTADLAEFTRVRREMQDFLEKYLETTRDLARIWWQPPLVFVALGDPGHGRTVALCMLAAFRRRELPVVSLVTKGIVHDAVKGHRLLRDQASREALHAFGTGSVLGSDNCVPLLRWIQGNAWACPHANLYTESTFNLMDRKQVGGPAMSPHTTETRVLLQRNHVHNDRTHLVKKLARPRDGIGVKITWKA